MTPPWRNDGAAVAAAVDATRLARRLEELASFNASPGAGITRIAFSLEEFAATEMVAGWLRAAGLTVSFDAFGNMFGSTDGNAPGATVSMAGSHIDTVPNGGKYDGAVGVVAAIESVEAMRAADCLPALPLEVVVWRCEEPVRFSQGRAGSLLFTGQVKPDDLRPIEDPPFDLAAALARQPARPQRAEGRAIASCLELHIEQGRRLERAERTIGVVTAIASPVRLRVDLRGSADHSGATPMDERRDALCAAAELVLAVEQAASRESSHGTVATAANITCRPGAINVVPGQATALIDIRGIDAASMDRVATEITAAAETIGRRRSVQPDVTLLSRGDPTPFDEQVISRLEETIAALGYPAMRMHSGAGHDVQCLADQSAAGMLFIPSKDGMSHNPEEYTRPDHIEAGTRALVASWHRLATPGPT
jgi:N-carbamoyl-L-amino-acid hydrolase